MGVAAAWRAPVGGCWGLGATRCLKGSSCTVGDSKINYKYKYNNPFCRLPLTTHQSFRRTLLRSAITHILLHVELIHLRHS